MKFGPVIPGLLRIDAQGTASSPSYGDVYHPASGAAAQARHVFLAGNGLPSRWRSADRFVILETGFGLGNNFLATWDAWRSDAERPERMVFISIEKHPLPRADLELVHARSAWPEQAAELLAALPPYTPDLHTLEFEGGRVRLLLALGDVRVWLPELVAHVDAFYLDGFAPARNPEMWEPHVCKALARLAAPGATLATWSAARMVRDGLRSAGFRVTAAPGVGGKRDITLATFQPAFTPRRPPARRAAGSTAHKHAVIVGAGLAGCAAAWALAEQGWTSTLIERHSEPAQEASGNWAGAFHGIVNPQDGAHARLNRAAALLAERVVREAVARFHVPGAVDGLLRLEPQGDVAAMRSLLGELGLPATFVRAISPDEARGLSGVALEHPGWFYPGGGWIDPAALARSFLKRCRSLCEFRGATEVAALEAAPDTKGGAWWRLTDTRGDLIEEAATLILANAAEALKLLGRPDWPLRTLRGQVSLLPGTAALRAMALPRIPITGDGYAVPLRDSGLLFGATSAADDTNAALRSADHLSNLIRMQRLCATAYAPPIHSLQGRVGWRCTSKDRLPVIGAVPSIRDAAKRYDQPRFVPREAGLHVFIGLGSRGITWAALGARLLASLITGAPAPLPSGLIDAVDPARFATRRARKDAASEAALR